jgi:hypothetical protein
MTDTKQGGKPGQPRSTPPGDEASQRPEVKSLVEKAGAEKSRQSLPGTMVTGGGTAGGGATKPLDLKTPHRPGSVEPDQDATDSSLKCD